MAKRSTKPETTDGAAHSKTIQARVDRTAWIYALILIVTGSVYRVALLQVHRQLDRPA